MSGITIQMLIDFIKSGQAKDMEEAYALFLKSRASPNNPKCCICGKPCECPYGNNAQPVMSGQCCNVCNSTKVIPARLAEKP